MALSALFPSHRALRHAGAGSLHELLAPGQQLAAALGCLPTNCFVADLGLSLVFMNAKAATTVAGLAPAIQSVFGLSVAEILGGSIHRFHRDPQRVERILNDPSALPREAVFSFGGVSLRTQINTLNDGSGQRIGYIVLWDNISERKASADAAFRSVEASSANLNGMVDTMLNVARDTSDQASSAAAATEELSAAVAEIARACVQSNTQTAEAAAEATAGAETLAELQRSSAEIGDFLRLITGVSEQTRMLALNATIEAARAGDAGRGFAVVADEVKKLAATTAASIGDIEARISSIQTAARDGVDALSRVESLIGRITESQGSIVAAMEEQTAVCSSLADLVGQMSDGAKQTVDQSSASARAMAQITEETVHMHQLSLES